MAKKRSAIAGEYIIDIAENAKVTVYRIFDNVKGSLREIAELKGFEYDPQWTTQQLGAKLINEYGEGRSANIGEYYITRLPNNSIESYRIYANTLGALREISEKTGFEIDPKWNTQQTGRKLVDFINAKG